MGDLEKKRISKSELNDLIQRVFESQRKFNDIKWQIIIKKDAERGENFDVELTFVPPRSSVAVREFLEQVSKIKGEYSLNF